jgi:hypothetical protein
VFAKSRGTRNEGWWRLRLVLAACTALGLLWGVSSAGAETVSQTFTYTGGEQTFVVPVGVWSIGVSAVAGHGGDASSATGGLGADVRGELHVTPGEMLYVEVGGNGVSYDCTQRYGPPGSCPGGFNGGGAGGGGGGGASDVRLAPREAGLSPDTRLLVAGGGGGAGLNSDDYECVATEGVAIGGSGGNAGEAGGSGDCFTAPGGAAGSSFEGGEGVGGCGESAAGVLGAGGSAIACDNYHPGGGGGGGYYGGGAGGGSEEHGPAGGGGGGGSSLVPEGGSLELSSEEPFVEISYPLPPPGHGRPPTCGPHRGSPGASTPEAPHRSWSRCSRPPSWGPPRYR